MTTVAIMQPYFIPYAGYFRLFAASDLFVIYDCVQFPRRGWVHRNQLVDKAGVSRWLTLPLAKAPQDVLIRDLRFAQDAPAEMQERLARFMLGADSEAVSEIIGAVRSLGSTPVEHIVDLLRRVAGYLELPWNVVRSTALDVPASLHGQDRILEIARRVGATRYVNAPGGRDLYDPAAFAEAGIALGFLPDYAGPTSSILTRIIAESRDALAADIRRQSGAAVS